MHRLPQFAIALAFMVAGNAMGETILFIGNSFTYGQGSAVRQFRADTVTDLNHEGVGGVPALFKSFTADSPARLRHPLHGPAMTQIKAIVFDLYGTLYDVRAANCEAHFPQRGGEISLLWRQKQLEYTWLRSLMAKYVNFEKATEDGLIYACNHLHLELDVPTRVSLCNEYLRIEPFPEVPAALRRLNAHGGVPLAILSNGSVHSIKTVVQNFALEHEFAHLISVDEVQIFKPHPRVYELEEQILKLQRSEILFVSSNPWDATGARYFGYPVCWVNRSGGCFDELGQRPEYVVTGLDTLAETVGVASGLLPR